MYAGRKRRPALEDPQTLFHRIITRIKSHPVYKRLTQDFEDPKFDQARAQRDFDSSRPPTGIALALHSIRLIELFEIEDLGRLQKGILRLFPGIENDLSVKLHIRSLLNDAADVFMTDATWNVGFIARSRSFLHTKFREMSLPEQVSYIDVKVIKFTASSFALCFDVHLAEHVNQTITELQSKKYYTPPLPLITRMKWAFLRQGFEIHRPERRQEILKYLSNLRSEIEKIIDKYFRGYFLQQRKEKYKSRLPTIDVFILKGEPVKPAEFEKWSHDTRGWWDTLGLDFDFSPYRSDVSTIDLPPPNGIPASAFL